VWTQTFDPLGQQLVSAAVAAIPIVALLWALVIARWPAVRAGALTLGLALTVAIGVYRMPVALAAMASIQGACYGVFPISWIVFGALALYQVTVRTGRFDILKHSIAALTDDRRLQALLIAFSFGAFLEGCAGFGAPVAIAASMLVGLGFDARYAAGLCLIANTAPVAFGSIGIPLVTAAQVTGLDLHALSQMVGRQLPVLSLALPFYLLVLMSGWRGLVEVWPAALVSGLSFAITQFAVSNYLGPALPDILSAVVSILALVALLSIWKPSRSFRFADEPDVASRAVSPPPGAVVAAWIPFALLTLLVSTWGLVQPLLDRATFLVPVPWLDRAILNPDTGKAIAATYRVNWLGAAGTAVLVAAALSAMSLRLGMRGFLQVCGETARQLARPVATIALFLAFAFLGTASGMTTTLGRALAGTGPLFPFFAPIVGWVGVFITGSDTSANALFGRLQQVSADQLGVSPILAVAANSSGGVTAKMISPQSIAVACAATGLVGREPDLLRFTLPHSIGLVVLIGVMTWLQATALSWMVPTSLQASNAASAALSVNMGATIAGAAAIAIALIAAARKLSRGEA
jgi:lactate permease